MWVEGVFKSPTPNHTKLVHKACGRAIRLLTVNGPLVSVVGKQESKPGLGLPCILCFADTEVALSTDKRHATHMIYLL